VARGWELDLIARAELLARVPLYPRRCGDVDAALLGAHDRLFVPGVGVPDDPHARIAREHSLEAGLRLRGAVGDDDHAGVEAHTHAHPTAVVERHPARARGRVHERVQDREVGDGVGAVLHGLGLPVRRGDAAAVEVVPADDDGSLHLALAHERVEREPDALAVSVPEPADARREPLELHPLLGHREPRLEVGVVLHELADARVGHADVLGVPGERGPPKRPLALAEERPDVLRHEALDVERALAAGLLRACADVVAVVEDLGAALLEREHRRDLFGHAGLGALDVPLRVLGAELSGFVEGEPERDVAVQGVVCARLLGDEVGDDAALHELGVDLGRVAQERDRHGFVLAHGALDPLERAIEIVDADVDVAGVDALLDTLGIDLDREARDPRHRGREGLRATHAAEARGEGPEALFPCPCGPSTRAARRRRSRTCPGGCLGCRCRSTSRPSSGRTS
jgi:hypothetical protein